MVKKMPERKSDLQLPPSWCSRICRNSMQDVCVEQCAVGRDTSFFELKKIPFEDMPAFPIHDFKNFTKEEKATVLAVYVSRITEVLQGVDYERPIANRPRSVRLPEAFQIPGLSNAQKEAVTLYSSKRAPDSNTAK